MQGRISRRPLVLTLVIACLGTGLLLAGCQSSEKMAAGKTSAVCPQCEMALRSQPIAGLEYTTCVCPSCQTVSQLDAATREAVEAYTGRLSGSSVMVCDNCKAVVEQCAHCRMQASM